MGQARGQLGIRNEDLRSIKKARDSDRMLSALLGAVIAVAAFVTGYAVSREIGFGYPYSSVSAASAVGIGRRRNTWVIVLLMAVLAVFSYDLGSIAAHPTYGEGSYYGVFEREI